jgi:hypothetical protein
MPPRTLSFRLVPNVAPSLGRGIGFLEGHDELDAGDVFDDLPQKVEMTVRGRFDWWIAGNNSPGTWFHGFPNQAQYRECFVFKWKEGRQGHRFYGFLCNPWPLSAPGFQLCVLNVHARKNENETDKAELDRVNQWRASLGARNAIGQTYPEYRKERTQWRS